MDALDRDVVSSKYFAVALFSMDAKTPVRKSISNDDDMMVLQGTCMKSALVSDSLSLCEGLPTMRSSMEVLSTYTTCMKQGELYRL